MSREIPEYGQVVEVLKSVLYNLPPKIVAINGRDGAGKTTLGRFLSWTFNSTLIETDLFYDSGSDSYHLQQISDLINRRLCKKCPVFVEGIRVLEVLEKTDHQPNFFIYLQNKNYKSSKKLKAMLDKYDKTYTPKKRANICIVAKYPKSPH